MASRFMTDPHAMRDMAGRFEVHAQTVEDEARRMWASAQKSAGGPTAPSARAGPRRGIRAGDVGNGGRADRSRRQ